jgi:hypothetical protein
MPFFRSTSIVAAIHRVFQSGTRDEKTSNWLSWRPMIERTPTADDDDTRPVLSRTAKLIIAVIVFRVWHACRRSHRSVDHAAVLSGGNAIRVTCGLPDQDLGASVVGECAASTATSIFDVGRGALDEPAWLIRT